MRNTDYWFNRELYELEKFARQQAAEHAEAGLPRQNAPVTEVLPIESVLQDRGVQIFLDWKERVRRRFQDGIQQAATKAGNGIVQLRHSLDQLELTQTNVEESTAKLRDLERKVTDAEKPMEYGSLLHSGWYWTVIPLLTVVDWIANVPVFTALLPQEAGASQRWANLVAQAETHGAWSGILLELYKVLFAPGAALLAVGVVISLIFLGHICGMNLRRLLAFKTDDESGGTILGLRSFRRQASLPFYASAAGMLIIVAFLFWSRADLTSVTTGRVNEARQAIAEKKSETEKAEKAGQDTTELVTDTNHLEHQADDLQQVADYAKSIGNMNAPILLLNLVLGVTAIAASYLHDKAHIVDARIVDPRIAAEEARLLTFRQEAVAGKSRVRSLDIEIQAHIAEAKYLATAEPLQGWPAKAKALDAMVPLFRAENACARGLDVQNIDQFKAPPLFPCPEVEGHEPFELPVQLGIVEIEYERLHGQIEAMNRRENSFYAGASRA